MKQLSIILSVFILLVLSGATLVQAMESTDGYLVSHDGDDIADFELKELLDQHIGDNYHSRVLAFTECYGGDKMDDFAGDRDTAILSGSTPGKVTYYGGYHRALACHLKPGTNSDTAHSTAAGQKHSLDTPNKSGSNVDIGTGGDGGKIKSTHVLVWAGQPEARDQLDINDIHNNFDGKPNTTVTVLSGDGMGPNVDGPATRTELVDALKTIGGMMNKDEQFIWFSTDHGSQGYYLVAETVPPSGFVNLTINMPVDTWQAMQFETANIPYISLITADNTKIAPSELSFTWNNLIGPVDVGSVMIELPMDNNNDGSPEMYEYQYHFMDEYIFPGPNSLFLQAGPSQKELSRAGVVIGDMQKYSFDLVADTGSLFAGSGGIVNMNLEAGAKDNANRNYLLLGSVSGTSPGTPLPGGATLPLNWDPLTNLTITLANTPAFHNTLGTLDGTGRAQAMWNTLGPLPPTAVGTFVNFAYVLANPLDFASNPWEIEILP